MKHNNLFVVFGFMVVFFVAFLCLSAAAHVLGKMTTQTTLLAPDFVFGPEVFVRGRDKSKEIREFPLTGWVGPFILHVDNGGSEATDENPPVVRFGATVSLNGKEVLKDGDFAHTGSVNRIEVDLEDPSTLVVKLHGTPEDPLTIWIEGTKGAEVSEAGATVTDPDGLWEVNIPALALASPTEITVKPAIDFPDDPSLVPRTAFEFGPDGTLFGINVQVTIAYDPNNLPAGVMESDLKLHKVVGGIWQEVAGSSVDEVAKTVTGDVDSFSTHGVKATTAGIVAGDFIFRATFSDDIVDEFPDSPEIGEWVANSTTGGTIFVRGALGDLATQPLELTSTGGGSKFLIGGIPGPSRTTGVYVARWRALVHSGSFGFTVGLSGGGFMIASVSLPSTPINIIRYNGALVGATWATDVSQLFEITIDLDNNTTTFSLDGTILTSAVPFATDNLDKFVVGIGGATDPASFVIDDIEIERTSPPQILIYGPTMDPPTPGSPENEQTLAEAAGFTVTVADAATWASFTTEDFEAFDAIVLGDKDVCRSDTFQYNPMLGNRATWSPAITGPIILIGGNPQSHQSNNTGYRLAQILKLITNGIKFAADVNRTGLYVSLDCPLTEGDPRFTNRLLREIPGEPCSPFCSFAVRAFKSDVVSIRELAHPAMQGLTSAGLSGWESSVHAFFRSFPGSFAVRGTFIVVATTSNGDPYIIARSP